MSNLYYYKAKIRRIIDGDSLVMDIDHGRNIVQRGVHVRLYGINAPEVRGPEREAGILSSTHLINLMASVDIYTQHDGHTARDCIIQTHKDKTGKYGRDLVTIYLDELDGSFPPTKSVNEMMVRDGFAEWKDY